MIVIANAAVIIFSIVGLVAVGIAAFYITRMMKGKIELAMTKTGFNSGEDVTGKVTLTTKKSLNARRVFVALIGYEVVERRDSDGETSEDRNEVFRDDFNLEEGETQLHAGFNKTYGFVLKAPGKDTVGTAGGGAGITIGSLVIGGNRRRLEWKVETRVDLPGVDIAKSKKVRINVA